MEKEMRHGKVESKQRFPLFYSPDGGGLDTSLLRYTNNLAGAKHRALQGRAPRMRGWCFRRFGPLKPANMTKPKNRDLPW
jgi:hypothetical protein